MKPFKISRDSWHHRLATAGGLIPNQQVKLCGYAALAFKGLLVALWFASFIIACIASCGLFVHAALQGLVWLFGGDPKSGWVVVAAALVCALFLLGVAFAERIAKACPEIELE